MPTSGRYCHKSQEVALLKSDQICLGELKVKGKGVLTKGDEFGVPYVRVCPFLEGNNGMTIEAGETPAIINCRQTTDDGTK